MKRLELNVVHVCFVQKFAGYRAKNRVLLAPVSLFSEEERSGKSRRFSGKMNHAFIVKLTYLSYFLLILISLASHNEEL